jgi:hypothetical protein
MPPFSSDGPQDRQRRETDERQQREIGTTDQPGRRERKDAEEDATDRRQPVMWGWHVARLQRLEALRCSQAHNTPESYGARCRRERDSSILLTIATGDSAPRYAVADTAGTLPFTPGIPERDRPAIVACWDDLFGGWSA